MPKCIRSAEELTEHVDTMLEASEKRRLESIYICQASLVSSAFS
jgi:hypothetical protein